jgi:hypothetical protein
MLYTTLNLLHDRRACSKRYAHFRRATKECAYGRDDPIPLSKVLEVNGLEDALWCLDATTTPDKAAKLARLFACNCAERALPVFERQCPGGQSPRQAVETARRYAVGEATCEDLDAAYYAAWLVVEETPARAAQIAASAAMFTTVRPITVVTQFSSRKAAQAIALKESCVERPGATGAAGNAEREWQIRKFAEMLEEA